MNLFEFFGVLVAILGVMLSATVIRLDASDRFIELSQLSPGGKAIFCGRHFRNLPHAKMQRAI